MNTRKNQRYQETEDAIIAAFTILLKEKVPEKITVTEICKKCGINRSSFYLHYQDIYDLMDKIEERLAIYFGNLFTMSAPDYNLGNRFLKMFRYIYENRFFYRIYLERNPNAHIFDAILPDSARDSTNRIYERLGFTAEYELLYHQTFFKAGLAAMLREWIFRGCPESPEELAEVLGQEYSMKQIFFRLEA